MFPMNKYPGIDTYDNYNNPTLKSIYSPYELPFAETKESLADSGEYANFLNNAISRFRSSVRYNNYKSYLINLGLDRCQIHSNITVDMASVEMHHHIVNIFEIALMITEHTLNTYGYITTFDLVYLLKIEHMNNNIPLVMMTKTPHQVYHNKNELYIHPRQVFGNWGNLFKRYYKGITLDIAFKLRKYFDNAILIGASSDKNILELREVIKDWSGVGNGCDQVYS